MVTFIYQVVWSILLVLAFKKTCFRLYRWILEWNISRKFLGLPGTRLLQGDLYTRTYDEYMERTLDFVQTTGAKIHTVWIYFLYPIYSLNHPDTAKQLLKSTAPKGSGSGYLLLKPWIGNGLLAHPGGNAWERNRHLLTPAFHFGILKQYVETFNDVADDLLIQLAREGQGQSVEIASLVSTATLDSLLRCALSYHGNIQDSGEDHPYVDAVRRLSRHYIQRVQNPLLYTDFVYYRTNAGREFKSLCEFVHRFADDIISRRRKILSVFDCCLSDVSSKDQEHKEQRLALDEEIRSTEHLDFLDILLTAQDDTGRGLTDLEIRSEVDTFLFAGHDTTSSAISWGIYALARYETFQEQVWKEVNRVAGQRSIQWADLSSLTNLASFIKEVMRMYSIVPMLARVIDEPMTFNDVTIPTGSIVNVNIHAINHRKDLWLDHDEFRPDRFLEQSSLDKDPFKFIPFSAGSRNCIGQHFALNEIKVMLSRIVQTFRLELDKKHKVIPSPSLVMRAKYGIKVYLHPR